MAANTTRFEEIWVSAKVLAADLPKGHTAFAEAVTQAILCRVRGGTEMSEAVRKKLEEQWKKQIF